MGVGWPGVLPVRVDPRPGEALGSYVRRLAVVNRIRVSQLTRPGRRPDLTSYSEQEIEAIAAAAGKPLGVIESMTLSRAFSRSVSAGHPAGCARRGVIAYCPGCTARTGVWLRDWQLVLVVACKQCRLILRCTDPRVLHHPPYRPSSRPDGTLTDPELALPGAVAAPDEVLQLQEQMLRLLHERPDDVVARERMRATATGWNAMRHDRSPVTAAPLTAQQLELIDAVRRDVQMVANLTGYGGEDGLDDQATMIAALLTRWEPRTPTTSELTYSAPVLPGGGRLIRLDGADLERHRLVNEFQRLRDDHLLGPQHVPARLAAATRPTSPETARWGPADRAVALHQVLNVDLQGRRWGTVGAAHRDFGTRSQGPLGSTITQLGAADPGQVDDLIAAAHALVADGLVDYRQHRARLRHVALVDAAAMRGLSAQARAYQQVRVLAAAWIWEDLTRGPATARIRGSVDRYTLQGFGRLLTPEDRLLLRDHGEQLCCGSGDAVALAVPTRGGPGRGSVVVDTAVTGPDRQTS